MQDDTLSRIHDIILCPAMNPSPLTANTREDANGIDLNRDYTNFNSHKTVTHRDWCHQHIQTLDLALHLHEDWEAKGFYLYELNFENHPSHSPAILKAVAQHIAIETSILTNPHLGGCAAKKQIPISKILPHLKNHS